jgi:hypothetical protein
MRAIGSALAAMTMMISGALADTPAPSQGILAPGKPAGAKQAQLETGGVLLVAGIVAVAAVIAIVVSTSDNNNSSTPSTTS